MHRPTEASMKHLSIVLVAVGALAAGCCKKEGDKAAGGDKAATGDKAAAGDKAGGDKAGGGAPAATKLPKLGLQIDAPGEIKVDDAIGGEGHMLMGSGIGAMSIEVAKEAQTVDAAKEDAGMYTPTNLKTETLPDGWAMSFENKGSMGTNYWVDVRRAIDGKSYKCGTTGSDAKQAAAVLAACKTLRK
jgi:hypothetical protein